MTKSAWTFHPAPPGQEVIETTVMDDGCLGYRLSALIGWGFIDGSVWPLTLSSDLDDEATDYYCVRFADGHVESQTGERWETFGDFLEAKQKAIRTEGKKEAIRTEGKKEAVK